MGVWQYCPNCDASMGVPTKEEVLRQSRTCHRCGTDEIDPKSDPVEVGLEMLERIDKLEDQCKRLEQTVVLMQDQLQKVVEILSTPVSKPNA